MADSELTYTVSEISAIIGVPVSEVEDKVVALGIKSKGTKDDASGEELYDVNDFQGI
jgi:hypothetical protein